MYSKSLREVSNENDLAQIKKTFSTKRKKIQHGLSKVRLKAKQEIKYIKRTKEKERSPKAKTNRHQT